MIEIVNITHKPSALLYEPTIHNEANEKQLDEESHTVNDSN